jgi:hypothetical protein
MVDPLSERLEYAILQIVCRHPSDARHQDDWGEWATSVKASVQEFVNSDLLAAFKRLWKRNVLRLSKPDLQRYHANEYSGSEADDNLFFFRGPFNATITDEGRSHWDKAEPVKTSVFISHIGEEKAIALKLQMLIQAAFANAFPVFVSSDPASLSGGEEWYHYILENLAKAKVVLVMLSPESAERPWINFEAGFGTGGKSRVIPLALRGLSFDTLDYPLKGLQGCYLPQLTEILKEISTRMGVSMGKVDVGAAWEEINDIEIELPAKKLALEMEAVLSLQKWTCHFHLVNTGNRDVEPIEVTVWVPSAILLSPFNPVIDAAILEVFQTDLEGVAYTGITYRNYREPMMPSRFSNPERLVARVTPGMRPKLQYLFFEARSPLQHHELDNPVRYKITCKNMKATEGTIVLKHKRSVQNPPIEWHHQQALNCSVEIK